MDTIEKGFDFSIKIRRKKTWLDKLLGTDVQEQETKDFHVNPPTLGVLDLITQICKSFVVDDDIINDKENPLKILRYSRTLVLDHARSLSKAIAVAVLGENVFYQKGRVLEIDWKAVNELADQIYSGLEPQNLFSICDKITATSELVNFTHSIRMMSLTAR